MKIYMEFMKNIEKYTFWLQNYLPLYQMNAKSNYK